MVTIFVSYRRSDSAYAAYSIYDRLARQFGWKAVVFDVDSLPLGEDYREFLVDQIRSCDAVLVIIGDRWIDARAEDGSRSLDNPTDPVRIEIRAALTRRIAGIPVLVGHARMPDAHGLPSGLKKLSYLHASEVRPGRDLPMHLDNLVDGVARRIGTGHSPRAMANENIMVTHASDVRTASGAVSHLQMTARAV
jgi:hypothetical protein